MKSYSWTLFLPKVQFLLDPFSLISRETKQQPFNIKYTMSEVLTRWTWFLFVSEGVDRVLKTQALKNAWERYPCSLWPLLRGTAIQWKTWKGKKEWGQGWASPASSGMMGRSRFVNRSQNWAGQGSLLQAVIMKASICQQRLSAAFPTSFLPTDSLGDAPSNVYDLTVDHHGTSTNRRLLSKTSRETLGAAGQEKKDPYSWRPQVKTEHPIPPVDTSTSC